MLHWIAIILGGIVTLFLIFYAYLVICSLIENTGYTVLSIVIGVCHAGAPLVFLFFGYRCFLAKLSLYGWPLTLLGAAACLLVYLAAVAAWEKLVLGDVPEIWVMGLITAVQLAVTGAFVYGFLHF